MIITRFHNMTQLQLTVEFLTPTFLGGADQNAELRAAPFKNLLRQWWRVAVGSQYDDPKKMLTAEGELFGSVLDDSKASASQVRLTLTPADNFNLASDVLDIGVNRHPEVGPNGMNVSNALYLGYGPITYRNRQTQIRRYIAPGSEAHLTLTFPKGRDAEMCRVLAYIDAFGTIGSRCRNGWGSLALSGDDFRRQAVTAFSANADALSALVQGAREYPTHLGRDGQGLLCWELGQQPRDWKAAMRALATAYMNLRTSINVAPQGLQQRHIMGYPVTNHGVDDWESRERNGRIRRDGRMPSQLRLMVKRNTKNELVARILHLPHRLPQPWDASLGSELSVWQDVHRRLDANTTFHRCGGAQ